MPLEAHVARTAHDLHHLNRLRVPGFGVRDLHLELSQAATGPTPAAGATPVAAVSPGAGPASKSYLGDGLTAERTAGTDDFHFAPVLETAVIAYRIDDPLGQLTQGKLELFRPRSATAIWTHPLTDDQRRDGEHRIDWTGGRLADSEAFAPADDFPDNCITAQHGPDKLRLTLGSDRQTRGAMVAFTFVQVLVKELEVELGPRTVLSHARDRGLYDTLGHTLLGVDYSAHGAPGANRAEGAIKEIRLRSNLFQVGLEMAGHADFLNFRTAWGDGPQLPVLAKVFLKSASDHKVFAPRGVGGVRLLWDWEDVAEDTSQLNAAARTFVDAALDYDKQATRPRGDNCHVVRGGKRGPHAAAVFPVQAGVAPAAAVAAGTFPFKVEASTNRTFAALSTAWGSGLHEGKSGVLFEPARQAGDCCKVTVAFAFEKAPDGSFAIDVLDAAPPLPAPVSKTLPASYQIWRRIDIARQKKKTAAVPNFPLAPFQASYEKAYVRMILAGAVETFTSAVWNSRLAAAVPVSPDILRPAVDAAVDQHAAGTHAVEFRGYNAFKTALQAMIGWTPAQMNTWLASPAGTSVATENAYHGWLSDKADQLLRQICGPDIAAADGINVFLTRGLYNLEDRPGGAPLNGYQTDFPGTGRHKGALVLCAGAHAYDGGGNALEQTAAHEVGHALFLAHAPDGVTATDAANIPDLPAHDTAAHHCMMSYNFDAARKFCGLCLLRLRGWDRNHLGNTAASNRHT